MSEPCKILAVVIDNNVFRSRYGDGGGKVLDNGDWVTLIKRNDWNSSLPSYCTKVRGTWGRLGTTYRPVINLETGERYNHE